MRPLQILREVYTVVLIGMSMIRDSDRIVMLFLTFDTCTVNTVRI